MRTCLLPDGAFPTTVGAKWLPPVFPAPVFNPQECQFLWQRFAHSLKCSAAVRVSLWRPFRPANPSIFRRHLCAAAAPQQAGIGDELAPQSRPRGADAAAAGLIEERLRGHRGCGGCGQGHQHAPNSALAVRFRTDQHHIRSDGRAEKVLVCCAEADERPSPQGICPTEHRCRALSRAGAAGGFAQPLIRLPRHQFITYPSERPNQTVKFSAIA